MTDTRVVDLHVLIQRGTEPGDRGTIQAYLTLPEGLFTDKGGTKLVIFLSDQDAVSFGEMVRSHGEGRPGDPPWEPMRVSFENIEQICAGLGVVNVTFWELDGEWMFTQTTSEAAPLLFEEVFSE